MKSIIYRFHPIERKTNKEEKENLCSENGIEKLRLVACTARIVSDELCLHSVIFYNTFPTIQIIITYDACRRRRPRSIEMALVISDDAFIFSNLFICSGGKHVKHARVLCTIVSVRFDLHQQLHRISLLVADKVYDRQKYDMATTAINVQPSVNTHCVPSCLNVLSHLIWK